MDFGNLQNLQIRLMNAIPEAERVIFYLIDWELGIFCKYRVNLKVEKKGKY